MRKLHFLRTYITVSLFVGIICFLLTLICTYYDLNIRGWIAIINCSYSMSMAAMGVEEYIITYKYIKTMRARRHRHNKARSRAYRKYSNTVIGGLLWDTENTKVISSVMKQI